MVVSPTITEEIAELKRSRKAVILAHHYQDAEIQELADAVGDSLELARQARDFAGEVIAFCGVWFMAETAKVLNPERIVVVPDKNAGCSLVDSCPVEDLRAWKRAHPEYAVVSYINTSVEVKAESDILCTSRNAVKIVSSIPAERPVMFLPDLNLGDYVKQQTGRENMKIWPGACIVHATFPARRVTAARVDIAGAGGGASGVPRDVLAMADFVGSTSAIVEVRGARGAGIYCDDGERGDKSLENRRRRRSSISWRISSVIAVSVLICGSTRWRNCGMRCKRWSRVELAADVMAGAVADQRMLAVK